MSLPSGPNLTPEPFGRFVTPGTILKTPLVARHGLPCLWRPPLETGRADGRVPTRADLATDLPGAGCRRRGASTGLAGSGKSR